LADVRLYLLLDIGPDPAAFELKLRRVAPLVDVIQLRDKQRDDRRLLDAARRVRQVTKEANTLFVMNDRPDLALLAGADGVHLGQDDMPPRDARRLVGGRLLIGVSTHSIEQARQAVLDGADYLGCGPTFPSGTKAFDHFPGLPFLRAVQQEIRLPCFAIGGIDHNNIEQVRATGLQRVAVSGCIGQAADPEQAAGQLREML
jgi:thiamine-phosphate pyrophosphorylase